MTATDGTTLCETIEDLYEWLENSDEQDYDLPAKLTDNEKMEILNNLFDKNQE